MNWRVVVGLGLLLAAAQCVYCPYRATLPHSPDYRLVWDYRSGRLIDWDRLGVQLAATGLVTAGAAVLAYRR